MIEQTGLLSEFADLPALLKQKEAFSGMLKELEADLLRIQKIKIDLGGSGTASTKDTISTMKQAQAATESFTKSTQQFADVQVAAAKETKRLQEELVRTSTKLAGADTQQAKATAIVREEIRKKNAETKNAIREETAAKGSIEQLRAALIRLQRTYDNLSASQRNSKLGKSLLKEIQGVSTEVKTLEAQTNRFQRNVGNYKSAFGGLADSIGSIAKAYLGIFAAERIIGFIGDSVKEFNEAEDGISRLDRTLTNVGRNDALPRLQDKAKNLMNEFKTVDDDEIIAVFDQLITYGKLTEKQIDELTPVIINFAAKQKISLADSASVIIKALEGNGKALKEYGIDIKDAKGTTEAFGLVMSELAPRVEGAAKAFGETTRGQIQKTKVEIGELKEQIGEELQPAIKKFYQFLAQGINGIPQLFSGAASFIDRIVTKINTSFRIAVALAKFDFEGARRIQEEVKMNERRIAGEKEYLRIKEKAAAIGASVENSSEEDQQRILAQNIALRDASADAYKKIFDAGKSLTAEGRRAAQQFIADQEAVNQIEAAIAKSKDNRVLGKGGKLAPDEKKPKEKKQTDLTNETLAALDKERKAGAELVRLQIEIDKKYQEEIFDNEKQSLSKRLQALEDYTDDSIALVKIDGELELKAIDDKLDQIALIEKKSAKNRSDEEKKLLLEKGALISQRTAVEASVSAKEIEIIRNATSKKVDIIKQGLSDEDKERQRILEQRLTAIDAAEAKELNDLKAKYDKNLITARKYEVERTGIQNRYELIRLQQSITNAKDLFIAAVQAGDETQDLENKLADASLKLDDYVTNQKIANQKKLAEARDGFIRDASEAFGEFISFQTDKEKNRIQDQIDAMEVRRQKEIDGVNASVATEEEKAARITAINASADAQKTALEKKQRDAAVKGAQIDKAVGLLKIGVETAKTVGKLILAASEAKAEAALLLGNPLTAAYAPVAFASAAAITAQIPFAIASGALQASLIAARPIPRFYKGGNHEGGPMIVGDGGRKELIEYPTGERFITPDKPTLTVAPKGTHIYPDADVVLSRLMHSSMKRLPDAPVTQDGYGKIMSQEIGRKLDTLTSVVRNKKEVHATATHSGITLTQKHLNSWLQYVDQQIHF